MRILTLTDPETEEEIILPLKWEICDDCRGEGKSSAYLGAFTQSDLDQEDPDFLEEYMAGQYDRSCVWCRGSGKTQEVDLAKLTEEQVVLYNAACEDERHYQAMCAAERRMGA